MVNTLPLPRISPSWASHWLKFLLVFYPRAGVGFHLALLPGGVTTGLKSYFGVHVCYQPQTLSQAQI